MTLLSGDDGSDNDKYAFQLPDDERLSLLESGSAYSHTDDVINADVQKCFANAKYCALHINIHNLPTKYDHLTNILSWLKEQGIVVHFILLCETFLNENNAHMFQIPGYSFIHNSRKNVFVEELLCIFWMNSLSGKGQIWLSTMKVKLSLNKEAKINAGGNIPDS